MAEWCVDNNLVLNTTKTNEILVDFRSSKRTTQTPLTINGEEVERVDSVKFLGTNNTKDLTWATNISNLVKRAQKRLFFPLKLKQAGLSSHLLIHFDRSTIESILCQGCSVWYAGCTAESRRDLARVVRSAVKIIGAELPDLDSVCADRLKRKAWSISTDKTHPGHTLFVPLPSGKRYRTLRARTTRLRNSFSPRAVASITPPTP